MLRTRGAGVQDNWDLWINASVFGYNTTESSSTGVTLHYAMFGCKATLPVDWVFPTPSVEKRMMYQWMGDMLEETKCLQKHERCTMWKSTVEPPDVQTINQNIRAGCLVWYYDPRIIPGTSHKLRSFWAGPHRVLRLIAPALGEIKPVYYPGEKKLVSLDVLKLYHEKIGFDGILKIKIQTNG